MYPPVRCMLFCCPTSFVLLLDHLGPHWAGACFRRFCIVTPCHGLIKGSAQGKYICSPSSTPCRPHCKFLNIETDFQGPVQKRYCIAYRSNPILTRPTLRSFR